MLRIIILLSGIISFLFFISPNYFPKKENLEKVLGVKTTTQALNASAVNEALTIYCINHGTLPKKLNDLFGNELNYAKVDLDQLYTLENTSGCNFDLKAK
ncbi:MAG TPA: hypothetical protein VLE47_01230 [Candidatus Saccharimonadales bacterium]|nr:hypothetical protein [Candidatus Saccharimonadales bacterium]